MGTISHFDMPSSPYYNTKSKEMGDSKLLDEISKLREWWVEDLKSFTDIKNKTINFKEVIMKNLQNKNKEKGKTQKKIWGKTINLEFKSNSVEQYGRWNNIEITGVPVNISNWNQLLSMYLVSLQMYVWLQIILKHVAK